MIELNVANGVAEILLANPAKLNTLSEAAVGRLDQALAAAEQASARALVLRGEGRAFCAGRDISAVDPAADDAARYLDGIVQPVLRRLSEFPAPTYGVGHGACLGVGLGLLIACDVVYVADDAAIGSPFGNLGAVLDSGGPRIRLQGFDVDGGCRGRQASQVLRVSGEDQPTAPDNTDCHDRRVDVVGRAEAGRSEQAADKLGQGTVRVAHLDGSVASQHGIDPLVPPPAAVEFRQACRWNKHRGACASCGGQCGVDPPQSARIAPIS
ncbi:MAG: enoyl-CoA hydratase/isomerase family protein [Bifidobacteriaceae bacterium]|jgi:hypothetical protein|nr:enoyl-CoA hydratase/isomerase family protein [Bifidobacteriaceae bacterium]